MDVPVEHRDGPEPLQIRERAFAVLRAPSPLRVHRPEWDVREHDDGCAALETFDILLEPLELFGSERAEPARPEVDHVDQADEVSATLIEAVPPGALGPLAEACEIALPIVLEHVVL